MRGRRHRLGLVFCRLCIRFEYVFDERTCVTDTLVRTTSLSPWGRVGLSCEGWFDFGFMGKDQLESLILAQNERWRHA